MRSSITVSLPPKLKAELDRLAKAEGISRSDVVRESVRDYLFIRRFRALRKSMVESATKQGIITDQDMFDRVS